MIFAALCVVLLGGVLLVLRARASGAVIGETAWNGVPTRRSIALGAVGVLLGVAPLFAVAPWSLARAPVFTGDAASHARVARELAESGLPHGWISAFLGGFPFGHHYPPLGWLLTAGLLRAGFGPATAIGTVGWGATLALPFAVYAAALRARGRPVFAALGATFVLAVSPYNPFVGGYEAFFTSGLVSQVLALPCVVLAAGEVARGGRAGAVLAAALAMVAHPEVAAAAIVLVATAALASGSRRALLTAGFAAAGAGVLGAALYGQGALTLGVPFGWPPDFGWRHLGFGFRRWDWWLLDGDLFDRGRDLAPLTALGGVLLLTALLRLRRPAPRAAVALLLATMLASSLGPTLERLGGIAALALSVLQPLRVLAFLPLAVAALLVVTLEEALPLVVAGLGVSRAPALRRVGAGRAAVWLLAGVVALPLLGALPNRVLAARELRARWAGGACEPAPPGYVASELQAWVGALHGGRLWFDHGEQGKLALCGERDGLVVSSSVAMATTSGAGAHVGMEWLAGQKLAPERAGAAARAESLGIRYILMTEAPAAGFGERRRHGSVALYAREGGTDFVGAGCVVERWQGSDAALRERLVRELGTPRGTDTLLDPARLTELVRAPGALVVSTGAAGGCDPTGATIRERDRESGAFEADIDAPNPVDVVFRATAFPTWRVTLDTGPALPTKLVAPGFFAVRVPRGKHHLVATVSLLPGYGLFVSLGVLGVLGLAFAKPRGAGPGRKNDETAAFGQAREKAARV